MRIEIQDHGGVPIPGWTLEECDELVGDRIDQPVQWRGRSEVAPLVGRPVRLRLVLRDAEVSLCLAPKALEDRVLGLCARVGTRFLRVEETLAHPPEEPGTGSLPRLTPDRRAMMLYTSGTTSKPKGVVTTHGNIRA